MTATTGLRAALYLRQSLDIAGDEMAVSRQEKANRDYCAAKGWTVVKVYRENDTSASGRKPRPKFNQMLADGAAGEFDVIVSTFLDRLTRSVRDLLPLIELFRQHHVATATVRDGIDLTTDVGELVATILAAVAHMEIKRKGQRQQAANDQRADNGLPHIGGARPIGYDEVRHPVTGNRTTFVIRESEAVYLRKAYADVLAGRSASSIAKDLNAAGLTTTKLNTKRKGKWTHHAVKQVLTNPRYAGLKVHRGEIIGKANWKEIVDEATFRAACAILTDPSRRTNFTGSGRIHLGTSLYRCGVCDDGTTMVSNYADNGRRVYRCRSGKHLTRVADTLDMYVVAKVLQRLSLDDAADLLIDHDRPDQAALQTEATRYQTQLDEAAAAHADEEITLSQMKVITKKVTAKLKAVQAQMEHTSRTSVLADIVNAPNVDTRWAEYTEAGQVDRQQAIIDAVATVTVLKGKVGGNSRVTHRPVDPATIRVDLHR